MKKVLLNLLGVIVCLLPAVAGYAQSALKDADKQYELYNYEQAAPLYLKAYKNDSTLYIAQRLANAYRLMHDYFEAEKWYAIAVEKPESPAENTLRYAEVLRNNGKYAQAKSQYARYYVADRDVNRTQLKYWSAACDSALRWQQNPQPVDVKNEVAINCQWNDWGAVRYGSNVLLFSSDRRDKAAENRKSEGSYILKFDGDKAPDKRIYGWTGNNYLHLYQFTPGDTATLFTQLNATDYHTGPVSITADGNEMYFTITRVNKNWNKGLSGIKTFVLEVYSSRKDGSTGKWQKPQAFKYNNTQKWSVGDPFITADGQTLYFVSDMPGGQGGTDIYYCKRDAQGWLPPVSVKEVNSAGNERTPYVDAEGNMFFSSDGHLGMGGLDIFKAPSTGELTFGPVQNLRYPVNSPRDDLSYVIYDGTNGYFTSNRVNGNGEDDIYSFTRKKDISLRLEGIVYEKGTSRPVSNAKVGLSDGTIVTTGANGSFSFYVKQETDYRLRTEKTAYLSDNQGVSTKGITTSQTIRKDLYLDKIVLNKAIRLDNIYYDFDKWNIRPDAAVELDKLIKILQDNPTIEIELGSHTDSRGNDDYNMTLSRKRANAAVEYIIDKGNIDEGRITARGYGETRLLNRCANGIQCSDEEHQLNRRTEFTIVQY